MVVAWVTMPDFFVKFIAGEEQFAHYIAIGTEMLSDGLYPQIVKTEPFFVSIILYRFKPHMVKGKNHVAARDHFIFGFMRNEIP